MKLALPIACNRISWLVVALVALPGVTGAQQKAAPKAADDPQSEFARDREAVFGAGGNQNVHPTMADVMKLMSQYEKAARDPKLLQVVTMDAIADQKEGKFGSVELQIIQAMQNQRIIALLEQMVAQRGGAARTSAGNPGAPAGDLTAGVGAGGTGTGGPATVTVAPIFTAGGGAELKLSDPPLPVNGDDRVTTAKGVSRGRVTAKGPGWIEVTSDAGKAIRYIPNWIGGNPDQGGGPDRAVVGQLNRLQAGDRVIVAWHVNDHIRIDAIQPAP